MTEKKRGRVDLRVLPINQKWNWLQRESTLTNDADVYEILCQADIVAQEDEENAVNGLRRCFDRNNQ